MRNKNEILANIKKELKSASNENITSFIEDVCRNLKSYNTAGYFSNFFNVNEIVIELSSTLQVLGISTKTTEIFLEHFTKLYKQETVSGVDVLKLTVEDRLPLLKGEFLLPMDTPEPIRKTSSSRVLKGEFLLPMDTPEPIRKTSSSRVPESKPVVSGEEDRLSSNSSILLKPPVIERTSIREKLSSFFGWS